MSARLSSLRRKVRRRLDNALLDLRYRVSPWNPPPGSVHWLFVATFPNGGSTALAQLLASADSAVKLTGNGEGQWLVPHLLRPGQRWEASMPVNWPHVRRIWLHNVRRRNKLPCVVIEKSPTTMVRMRQAMQTFSDMPCRLLRFSRDPYAVCSSWASRYGPQWVAHGWGELTGNMAADSPAFFRVLGDIYGRRARVLHELADVADATISYEDLTRDTSAALDLIGSIEPLLADASAEAQLKVKDYAPQPLRNMNDRQIAALSDQQIAAIGEGLLPHADAVAALGYGLRA